MKPRERIRAVAGVRVSYAVDPTDHNSIKILEENHYYAFGLKHKNYNVEKLNFEEFPETGVEIVPAPAVANATYNYKYNGKELQEELGLNMYDYGARNYDPSLGRWMNMDELSEKYTSFSPYNYCVNNPARVIDPDGKQIIYVTDDGTNYYYKNGNFYNRETNERYKYNSKNADVTLNVLLKCYRVIEKSNDKILKNQLHTLEKSSQKHEVRSQGNEDERYEDDNRVDKVKTHGRKNINDNDLPNNTLMHLNFTTEKMQALAKGSDDGKYSFLEIVAHEMRHQYDYDIGNMTDKVDDNSASDPEEIRAVYNQNRARALEGRVPKTTYAQEKIDPKKLQNPPNNKNIMIK